MYIKDYIDKIKTVNFEDVKDLKLEDLIYKFHAKKCEKLYILKENKPLFVLEPKKIVDIFLNHQSKKSLEEFLYNKEFLECFDSKMNIIDAYYQMRKKNLEYIPVCENGVVIGEINFSVLSLKISYIVIKDELTGVFNRKYFDVIIEEYNDFNKPMGLIFIEVENLPIYEGLYGIDTVHKILRGYADILRISLRDIDFIFRLDNQFRVITFNNLEITTKIVERIKKRLNSFTIEDIHIPYKLSFSHIPELENNIISAIEECERKLIERN